MFAVCKSLQLPNLRKFCLLNFEAFLHVSARRLQLSCCLFSISVCCLCFTFCTSFNCHSHTYPRLSWSFLFSAGSCFLYLLHSKTILLFLVLLFVSVALFEVNLEMVLHSIFLRNLHPVRTIM